MTNPFDRNKTKEAKLGAIITEPGEQNQRDAVHIAVVPIIAACALRPGQRVSVSDNGTRTGSTDNHVGIVDPFLREDVQSGQTFWLFLFQGSVTTLRHEWTHPAFPAVDKADLRARDDKSVSEAWLRQYARRVNNYDDPEGAYRRLMTHLEQGEITYNGTDMHGRGDLQDEDELRHHAQIVLGRPINFDDFTGFYCSC